VFRVNVPAVLANRRLRSARIREDTGCSVVAVKNKDELTINPDPEMMLAATAELVIIGTARSEKTFMEKYPVTDAKA
jgi:K+/H+ antiporter YhaU regulatory subunit KhtT